MIRMSEQGDTHVFQVLADHARSMHAKTRLGSDAVLAEITGSAVQLIDGAVSAGITVTKKRKVVDTLAPTDDDAREFDLIQQQAGQSPCLDAAWQHRTVRVPDLLNDGRWPALAAEIRDRSPIRASVSYELFTHTEGMGALNVYATKPHAITDSEVEKGYALAAHAALVFDAARKYDQFQSALASPRHHRPGQGHDHGAFQHRRRRGIRATDEAVSGLQCDRCRDLPTTRRE